ncbi:hypothetical protein TYRP_005781 [Tyrophagus putrescentiae]|nr:hypothetical protein TYRP_005781 [Tyrophagus putrescentiae]
MMAIFGGMVASPRTLTRPASIAWTRKSSSLIVSTQYFGSGGGRPRSKTPVTLVLHLKADQRGDLRAEVGKANQPLHQLDDHHLAAQARDEKTYPLRIELAKHQPNKVLILDGDDAVGFPVSIRPTVAAAIRLGLVLRRPRRLRLSIQCNVELRVLLSRENVRNDLILDGEHTVRSALLQRTASNTYSTLKRALH